MASRLTLPFADIGSGIKPADGAQLFFTETGSSTPKATYSDSAATTPNSNPVVADSSGVFPAIFITGRYRAVLKDKNNVQVWSADPVDEFAKVIDTSTVKSFATLSAAVADTGLISGAALDIKERTTGNGGGATWDAVLSSTVTENTYNIVQGVGSPLISLVLRTNGVHRPKKYGAIYDGTTNDAGATQAMFNAVSPFELIHFDSGTTLINTQITNTTNDITVDLGDGEILNTATITSVVENGQSIDAVFFNKANRLVYRNGTFRDFANQGIYFGGDFTVPIVNTFTGATVDGLTSYGLISAVESKVLQSRHVDDVHFRNIKCFDGGASRADRYTNTLSINYANTASITDCVVDGNLEGGGSAFLYVSNGIMHNVDLLDIGNTLFSNGNSIMHIKNSNDIRITDCNVQALKGQALKLSKDNVRVVVVGNIFRAVNAIADHFANIHVQGTREFIISDNIIETSGARAVYCVAHTGTEQGDGKISGNRVKNIGTLANAEKGAGIRYVNNAVTDRRGVDISGNFLYNCDMWIFQAQGLACTNNNFIIDDELNPIALDNAGGSIDSVSSPLMVEACNAAVFNDNTIINLVTAPTALSAGVRIHGSALCSVSNNSIMYQSGTTNSYGFHDNTSSSTELRDNKTTNAVAIATGEESARYFMEWIESASLVLGTINAGVATTATINISPVQVGIGNTFLYTQVSIPNTGAGLSAEGVMTADGVLTLYIHNPTAGNIPVGTADWRVKVSRAPIDIA